MARVPSRISGIFLENFQAITNPVFIKLNKITLLYGPNSAGKSAIFDALYLIKETITNEPDWNFHVLYERHGANYKSRLGVEFILGNENYYKYTKWMNTEDSWGDFEHRTLFNQLLGKKIQIELSNYYSIKVACDGFPLFEILSRYTYYNDSYQRLEIREEDYDDSENSLLGKLVLYKNSHPDLNFPLFGIGEWRTVEELKDSCCYNVVIQDLGDRYIVSGIQFDPQAVGILVEVNGDLQDLLNDPLDGLTLSFGDRTKVEQRDLNRRLNNELDHLAKDFGLILQGLFISLGDAFDYSHVRGDRGLLNSHDCVSYSKGSRDNFITMAEKYRTEEDPIRIYSEYMAKGFSLGAINNKPKYDGDFVNYCLDKLILSLRGYNIITKKYEVREVGEGIKEVANELLYLYVKNKSGQELGFQNVGSGISFILPILTSLWCKKITFIEQPELHLHPKAQCEIGDVLIASTYYNNMALVESHSEYLLLRIARRIRETTNANLLPKDLKFNAEDLSIYYFDPGFDGSTVVKEIRLDRHGELLDHWPGGFFAERDAEIFS